MNTGFLYMACILIWGTTWYAITFQLGVVAPEISLAYRFGIASVLLFAFCFWKGIPLKINRRVFYHLLALGFLMFGLNYLLTYKSTFYLRSGVVALVFSLLSIFNLLNLVVILRQKLKWSVLAGSLLGISGVALVFRGEVTELGLASSSLWGLFLCTAATYLASLSNIVAQRLQEHKLNVHMSNAYGMAFGATLLFAYGVFQGQAVIFDMSFNFISSLLYLSVFGSIFAFGAYITLLGRIGAERAGYTTIMIPIVALVISTIFEDFKWDALSAVGIAFAVAGNVIVLRNKISAKKEQEKTAVVSTSSDSEKIAA